MVEKDGFAGRRGGEAEEVVAGFCFFLVGAAGFRAGPVVGPGIGVGVGFEGAVGEDGGVGGNERRMEEEDEE